MNTDGQYSYKIEVYLCLTKHKTPELIETGYEVWLLSSLKLLY